AMLLTVAVASGAAGVLAWTAGEARRWQVRQRDTQPIPCAPTGQGAQICGEMLLALTLMLLAVHFCS
ncbi:hypothetical protein, partial [Pseudomonas sp.]